MWLNYSMTVKILNIWANNYSWLPSKGHGGFFWFLNISNEFGSPSATRSGGKACATFNCWMGTLRTMLWMNWCRKWTEMWKMHSKFSMPNHGHGILPKFPNLPRMAGRTLFDQWRIRMFPTGFGWWWASANWFQVYRRFFSPPTKKN